MHLPRRLLFFRIVTIYVVLNVVTINSVKAETPDEIVPRYLMATIIGNSYSPGNDLSIYQLSAAALYDYDHVWPHKAPEPLRFKVELNAGVANYEHNRAIASANMLALYFIEPLTTITLTPYIEAGIGLIYTDYQIKDQGLRINFNPQVGVGTEIHLGNGTTYFIATRLHHISNGGLLHDNRGINSVMLQLGKFF